MHGHLQLALAPCQLVMFCDIFRYLGSRRGGEKRENQQREIATDVSKFLYLSNPAEPDLNQVIRMWAINRYVDEVVRLIGPSRVLGKLNALCHAQTFLMDR